MTAITPLLAVNDLRVDFGRAPEITHAVRGVSFSIDAGETLAVVGESGCGKSVTALAIMGLLDRAGRVADGTISFEGNNISRASEKTMRGIRGAQIAMVFQDPMTALNPTLTVGQQIIETIRAHQNLAAEAARAAAIDWLKRAHVSLPETRLGQYPHELSGGIRQRVMIAIAFSCRPKLLIADEPTTALDVTVQAQILDLIDELKTTSGTAVLLITHDLGIVAERTNRVAVMYAGEIVETAKTADFFASPQHPYAAALLASVPDWREPKVKGPLASLAGQPPSLSSVLPGCPFCPRCARRFSQCPSVHPALTTLPGERSVRCLLYEDSRSTD